MNVELLADILKRENPDVALDARRLAAQVATENQSIILALDAAVARCLKKTKTNLWQLN